MSLHDNCGGEIVSWREETRATLFGTMTVNVPVTPWCRKCGARVGAHEIVTESSARLTPEESRAQRARMAQEHPWLEPGKKYGQL